MSEKITIRVKENKNAEINRAVIAFLLVSYAIILLWIIVLKCNVASALNEETVERNLSKPLLERLAFRIIPFQDIYLVLFERFIPISFFSFVFNTICCIPAGMMLGFFLGKLWGLLWSGLFILGVEVFQLFSGWGIFDITDIFMNLLGVYLGYLVFDFLYKRLSERAINRAVKITLAVAIPAALGVIVHTALCFPL